MRIFAHGASALLLVGGYGHESLGQDGDARRKKDQTVPVAHSQRPCEAIRKADGDATLIFVKNANHGLKPVEAPSIQPSLDGLTMATAKFFDKHLKLR